GKVWNAKLIFTAKEFETDGTFKLAETDGVVSHDFSREINGVTYDILQKETDRLYLNFKGEFVGQLQDFSRFIFVVGGYEVPVNLLTEEEFNVFFRMDSQLK